jgi:hypothetical protein
MCFSSTTDLSHQYTCLLHCSSNSTGSIVSRMIPLESLSSTFKKEFEKNEGSKSLFYNYCHMQQCQFAVCEYLCCSPMSPDIRVLQILVRDCRDTNHSYTSMKISLRTGLQNGSSPILDSVLYKVGLSHNQTNI